MPKIQAATVVEHHAAQRAALLDAARALLSEGPTTEAPSLADVAARAGLARSSAYSYFSSREDLLNALAADTFPRWTRYVRDRMARHEMNRFRQMTCHFARHRAFDRADI